MDARKTETESSPAIGAGHWPEELAGIDDASSALVFRAFLNTMRLHRQLMVRTLTARGSHPGQAFCLRLLGNHDGSTQRDMAETLHLARPTLSRMLRTMEKADMIERRPDATDQRLTRVYLTPTGRDRERDLHAVASDYVKQTIGTLPEDDRRELARLLDAYAQSISRALAGSIDPRTPVPSGPQHKADASPDPHNPVLPAEATSAAGPRITEAAS